MIDLAQEHDAAQVLIEDASTAMGLIQELRYQVRGLTPVKPDRDKIGRMSIASARFEAGQVFFPERAPWLERFATCVNRLVFRDAGGI